MPLTLNDLIKWEIEKDLDKFHQFLLSNWDEKNIPLISFAINVLEKIHSPDSLKYIIMLNQDIFSKALSFQMRDVLVNWGEPVIDYLFDHITSSKTKFEAVKAFYTLGKIDDELIIPLILEIIHKNINLLEKDACKILQKKISFSTLVDLYKKSDECIRYALVKTATTYPFDIDKENFPIPSSYYAFFWEEIWLVGDIPELKNENQPPIEVINTNKNEELSFTTPAELFDFFELVMQDENVQVRFAGILGLETEIKNARSECFWRTELSVFPLVRNILLSILNDEDDYYILQKAIELLKNFNNDDQVYEELKKLYLQKDKLILEQLLVTLGDFKKEELLDDYIEIYTNNDFEQNVRAAALLAIVKIPNKKSIELLSNQNLGKIKENYLIDIVESLGKHDPQDTFDILLPLLEAENWDFREAAIKSIAEQNVSIWKNRIITFIEENDNPLFFYKLLDYLRTFCDYQAKKIIIKHIVNNKLMFMKSEYLIILQKLIGEESIRSYVNGMDVTNDNELQHDIEKLIITLDKMNYK